MAWKLLIDSSDSKLRKVSLTNNVTNEYYEKTSVQGGITELVASLLEEKNLRLEEIQEIEAVPGPGSFTGLKGGSVFANTINWALGRKKIDELTYPNYGGEPNISKPKNS